MPKTSTQATEKRATIPGLPSYLTVGTPTRVRSSRAKIGPEQLRKLFDWWSAAQTELKELKAEAVGIPVLKLAQEFGLQAPSNGNSFRANIQRIFDGMSVDGKTMYLCLRGAEGDKFRVTDQTMLWFRPVPVSERTTSRRGK